MRRENELDRRVGGELAHAGDATHPGDMRMPLDRRLAPTPGRPMLMTMDRTPTTRIGLLAAVCCALVVALAGGTTSSTASPAAPPMLVWETDEFDGALVVQEVGGSRPRLLGDGRRPRLSPDGRWVAFVGDEHTYVVATVGGRTSLVARDADPIRWSPDSRYLATVGQGRALAVFDMRTRRSVTIDFDATFHGVSFSPSSTDIVWARQTGRTYSIERGIDIVRARVDGTGRSRLVSGGRNAAPAWGRRAIAFGKIRPGRVPRFPVYELWTMSPGGDELRRVTRTSHIPVDWSDDGRVLLTSSHHAAQSVLSSRSVLSLVEPQTRTVRVILEGDFVIPHALSRDGRSALAWSWDPKIKPYGKIVRVSSNGSTRTLVRKAGEFADWNL